jgi:hypothetical protein
MNKDKVKKFLLRIFDINENKKLDVWELTLIIGFIILFQLAIQVGGNYLYDKIFTHNLDKVEHHEKN